MYVNPANLRLLHLLRVTGSVLLLQSHVTMTMPLIIIINTFLLYL